MRLLIEIPLSGRAACPGFPEVGIDPTRNDAIAADPVGAHFERNGLGERSK